jgi:hypothetical protein
MSTLDVFTASAGLRAYAAVTVYVTRLNATEQRSSDAGPRRVWDLEFELTGAEMAALAAFFTAHDGPYEGFIFLDPLDNLLKWSESFPQAAWEKSQPSFMQMNGTRITNTAGSPNVLSQAVPVSGIALAGSVSLKDATAPVTLRVTGAAERVVQPGADWTRCALAGTPGAPSGFEIELPAGASVDATAAQLVTGLAAGNYIRTEAVSGYHPGSHFESQELQHRATGPGRNRARVRIGCSLSNL